MKQHNYNKQHTLDDLVSEYEAMSQKGAVVFYEEAVFSQLIGYYQNEKAIDQALEVVELALTQHSYSANLYCKKAELLIAVCHESEALVALEQAELLSPRDYEVHLLKADIHRLLGNHHLALSILDELKHSFGKYNSIELADVFFSEGLIYEQMQNYDAMFEVWKEVLTLNPNHEEALDRIWACVELSRKFKEGIKICHKVIDNDPYCKMAWYNLGHAYTYFGNYSKAIEAYEYTFIIDEKFEWAYRDCAELCMEMKDYSKALDCYKEVLTHFPPDGELLFKIGQCYHFSDNVKIAQDFYRQATKLDVLNDEIYFHLGECAAHLQDWNSAIHYYKRAIEIESKREEYYASLAETYVQLEEYEKAFLYFDRATELAPEQTGFWIRFTSFLLNLGAHQEALDVLTDAEEYTVGEEILYYKVICLFKMGRRKQAMNLLGEALTEDFEMHTLLLSYLPELAKDSKFNAMLNFYRYEG